MTLLAAGQYWLVQIARPDSRLSARTIAAYTWTWATYVDARTSSLRGLTLDQANDPQRLRVFLQRVAEAHGSASAKKAKSVLNGCSPMPWTAACWPATPCARSVPSPRRRLGRRRDHTRAMTRGERDLVVQQTYEAAEEPGPGSPDPRKRTATADLVAFLAGTGVRIDEARRLRWDQVDLDHGRAYIHGTKSESSDRWLNSSDMARDAPFGSCCTGGNAGLRLRLASAPERSRATLGPEQQRQGRSRRAGRVWTLLGGAAHVSTNRGNSPPDQANLPIARIADQLGHSDVSMTARVYLGRDLKGDKRELADAL